MILCMVFAGPLSARGGEQIVTGEEVELIGWTRDVEGLFSKWTTAFTLSFIK